MRLALGTRDKGSERYRLNRQWVQFCGTPLSITDLLSARYLLLFFKVMTMLFTTIGSVADYETLGRWLLLVVTLICWVAQFATMSLTCKSLKL